MKKPSFREPYYNSNIWFCLRNSKSCVALSKDTSGALPEEEGAGVIMISHGWKTWATTRRVRAQVQGFFAAMRLSWLSSWTFLLNSFDFSIDGTINKINVNQNRLRVSWPPISLNHGSNAKNWLRCTMWSLGQFLSNFLTEYYIIFQ